MTVDNINILSSSRKLPDIFVPF